MARLTTAEKYRSLKKQTENAGMTVKEVSGKLVVSEKKGRSNEKRPETRARRG